MPEVKVEEKKVEEQNVPVTTESVATQATLAEKKQRTGVISELRNLQQDVKHFRASDLVVPILSLIFLALLTIFVYVPMVSSAVESRQERDEISKKITRLENVQREIGKIDVGRLQQDLSVSRSVIPFSLQVSDFILYLNEQAEDKGLAFREILAGDIQIRGRGEQRDVDPVIKGVSGPLKYIGSQSDIVEFLDEVQNVSPYIISADSVEIKKSQDSNDWELSLLITGYYLNQSALPKVDIYLPFASYAQYESVLNVFSEKSLNK